MATNGVATIPLTYNNINALLTGAGFTLGSLNGTAQIGSVGASGNSLFGQTQFSGTTGGSAYELIVVAWNASAGTGALVNGTYTDVGWSNPFGYTAGAAPTDPNGQTQLSVNMNQFGVAQVVPEPGTLALAAIGGASLLMFRRKK